MTLLADSFTDTARFRAYGPRHIDGIAERFGLPAEVRETIRAIARVLPFRVNEYVLTDLVDWHNIPDDPIFQLVFPQRGMLPLADELRLAALGADPGMKLALRTAVQDIRTGLNPHPSGQ